MNTQNKNRKSGYKYRIYRIKMGYFSTSAWIKCESQRSTNPFWVIKVLSALMSPVHTEKTFFFFWDKLYNSFSLGQYPQKDIFVPFLLLKGAY